MADARDLASSPAADGSPAAPPAATATWQVHPLDYLRVIYRRRRLVAAVILAAVAAGAAYTWRTVPIYEARTTILIESDEPNVVTFQEVLDEGAGQGDYFQTQYQLLESRALAVRTVSALGLANRPDFGATSEAEAVAAVRAGLRITPVRGSRIVTLRFRWPEPKLAAEIVNAHARAYIEQSLDLRFRASKEATEWLDAQLEEERRRVARSESALQAFREQYDAVSLKEGQDIVVQKLADLNAAVTRAKTNRIEKEAQYRELLAARQTGTALDSFPPILANAFIQQLKGDLARLQREYSQLSQTLGDRHPTLIEKRSEVQSTEMRLAAEIARVAESVKNAYEGAAAEEASMVRALEQQKGEALALNRRGIEYAALEREAESVRSVYQSLLQRARETSVSRELRATNIRIVDPAQPPGAPILPRPATNLALAFLGGCLIALGLVFTIEFLDDRLQTPDDVRRQLGLPFLGLVPKVDAGDGVALSLLHSDAPAPLIEAVRALRTSVLATATGQRCLTLLVASAGEGEGKTFVATSLAAALAQAQRRVLLIDSDMRRPRLHRVFDQDLQPGLSNLLAGTASLRDVLRTSAVPGLTVITAGTPSLHAPELLGSARFVELLAILREHYGCVVVDSPPALSVTDATIEAAHVDGVVLVVGSGTTRARAARLAAEELQRAGGTVIGAVLNRADVQEHPFYFAPYHRHEYHANEAPAERPAAATMLGRSA